MTFKESLKHCFLVSLTYTVLALVVYGAGWVSWWFSFVLFIIYALSVLQRLVVFGFVGFVEIAVSMIAIAGALIRGIKLNRLDEIKQPISSLLTMNLLMMAFEIYLVIITAKLGVSVLNPSGTD